MEVAAKRKVHMFPQTIFRAAQRLMDCCLAQDVRIVLAESCTGGLIAAALTSQAGASRILDRGYVVYSYESKEQELDVPKSLVEQFGAVSQQVVIAMATGALRRTNGAAQISLAVTGVAGPQGTIAKPVGLVHIAVARTVEGRASHESHEFGALSRDEVREKTVLAALNFAATCLDG